MRRQWLGVCVAAGLLAACSTNDDSGQQQVSQQPQPVVCTGPSVEVSGAEPRYEPLNPSVNQDYQRDGKTYKIIQDPSQFSQKGLAAIYDAEPDSNLTASGEAFDPTQLTAAHPTLPVPSYARITNLANGRMLIVRINDRGPYGNDRAISLSRAAADRLNTSNNTKVQIDPIVVAQDGTMSGPGMACITIAKQTYALPSRPDLSSGMGSASSVPQGTETQGNVRAISNDTLSSENNLGAPTTGSGFLGAPSALPNGVVEGSEAVQPAVTQTTTAVSGNTAAVTTAAVATTAVATQAATTTSDNVVGTQNDPVTAPNSVQGAVTTAPVTTPVTPTSGAATGQYVVQVGAVSDAARASQWQQKLSQQFGVPGHVSQKGLIYRVQMGPFASKADAIALQQRLLNEAQQQSFVTAAVSQ